LDFISDITKEYMKDILGQKIYYFSVSEIKSVVHDIYLEAPEKVFEQPIELDAIIEFKPQSVKADSFGVDETYDVRAWLHVRDMIDKGINPSIGDFFSYGDVFYEILKLVWDKTVYGEIEHQVGFEIYGKTARQSQFISRVFGPTEEKYADADSQQDTFVQQRGYASNRLGQTGDVRDLQKKGVIDPPLTGPKEVSKKGTHDHVSSAFYGDDE
jgi:hypothetical protein